MMPNKKRGLGRGLDALLDVEAERPIATLPLSRLKPNRFQPRTQFDTPELAELAASIRTQGVVQPIVVSPRRGGDYTIVVGERRWRAARQAGLSEVPVVIRVVATDRELLEMALVENLQRTDLNPMEEAEAYRRLGEEFGLNQEEVANRVGKSRSAVTNALRLLGLPDEVQDLLRGRRLTAGQARPLLALENADEQIRWARRAVRDRLSARDLERLPGGRTRSGKKRRTGRVDPDTAAAAERLTRQLQTRVEIHRRGKGGTVRIAFHSEEELMRLFDLLMQAGEKP
jgi:ParB family chromosome partitioning protein